MPLPSGSTKNVFLKLCIKIEKENTEITNGA
jgi:hypothetical protein